MSCAHLSRSQPVLFLLLLFVVIYCFSNYCELSYLPYYKYTMADDESRYDEQVKYVNAISQPLASKKTTKKLHKLVKKAASAKFVRRGVKEVVKALRKGEKGFCIIAGDISPIDVITHLPIMCEDRSIPYIYVPSKHDLGAAASTKRPTSCILVNPKKGFDEKELYDKLVEEAKSLAPVV
jgi:H/ACA ribonucleoprotein complex subunit 2